MNPINLIGKHLKNKYSQNFPLKIETGINSTCCFTGNTITEGIKKKDLIKDVFTDNQYIRYRSDYCSLEAALCMQRIIPQSEENKQRKIEKKKSEGKNIEGLKDEFTSLRNYHFICTESELKILRREEIESVLFNLPEEPFVFVITFGFKKHTTFKSKVNFSSKDFIITTDKADIKVNLGQTVNLFNVIQNWYTVIPGKETTSTKQTFFSKDDILNGCQNYKKIEDYGEKYFSENEFIANYRNTLYLDLIVYILNKKENSDVKS
jgi:hypothetical protein